MQITLFCLSHIYTVNETFLINPLNNTPSKNLWSGWNKSYTNKFYLSQLYREPMIKWVTQIILSNFTLGIGNNQLRLTTITRWHFLIFHSAVYNCIKNTYRGYQAWYFYIEREQLYCLARPNSVYGNDQIIIFGSSNFFYNLAVLQDFKSGNHFNS